MTAARIARRKAARLTRRSSAGDDPARLVAPHPWLISTPPSNRSNALSARPAISRSPCQKQVPPLLPAQSLIPPMPPRFKSP